MDVQAALTAIAEPTRFRIVRLLAGAPRAVGEIATAVGALQPQTTKHIMTLEAAGVVVVHRLGRRRVVALRRAALSELAAWLEALAVPLPDESVLENYERAIAAEEALLASGGPSERSIVMERRVKASPSAVWRAWTNADLVARWWTPPHFRAVDCVVEPVAGGALKVAFAEPDGTRHVADGRFLRVVPVQDLIFENSPIGPDGRPLFTVTHNVRFTPVDGATLVEDEISVSGIDREHAASALAGLEIGWGQSIDQLVVLCEAEGIGIHG